MANKEAFIQAVEDGYTFKGESVKIGCGVLDGEVIADAGIYLPLKTLTEERPENLLSSRKSGRNTSAPASGGRRVTATEECYTLRDPLL